MCSKNYFERIDGKSFVTSTIIGAANLVQLKENIDSIDVVLSDAVKFAQINEVHDTIPNSAP